MIVIITNDNDQSSNKIIEWLDFFEVDYFRINEGIHQASIKAVTIERNGKIVNNVIPFNLFDDNTKYITFFRRGYIWGGFLVKQSFGKYKSRIETHLKKESSDLMDFFYSNLNLCEVNSPINYRVNKLTALKIASNSGLKIPKTVVTNNRIELINAFPIHDLICKPITDNLIIDHGSFSSSHSPKRLLKEEVKNLPEIFGYSLFQELIDVKWEIRTFIFGDLVKSIAVINVKEDIITKKILPRLPGRIKRIIPIELPNNITTSIHKFMKSISLLTGSIDLLYSEDREFYFLEVNPVGQFDHVSYFGNYSLEKLIAEKLIEYHGKGKKER